MIQGTDDWLRARLGKVTASRIADVVAKTKSGWGASRANYMAQLLTERLTGVGQDSYINPAMQWGIDTEPDARIAYEFRAGSDVAECGFLIHPRIKDSGASPDGLIGADGLVEIKCPLTATHIDTLLFEEVPQKHVLQMQWQMCVTGRAWCDYVSYDPRLPEAMSYWCKRVHRDEKLVAQLESDVELFLAELDEKLAALRAKFLQEAA